MNLALTVPLSALAFWLAAVYIEKKFEFVEPDKSTIDQASKSRWKRLLVKRNGVLRMSGIAMCWTGANAASVLHGLGYVMYSLLAIGLCVMGLFIFIAALSWDALINISK
jgi:hypothetical protein